MNQNSLVVTLMSTKEKLHTFYQNKSHVVAPVLKAVLMLAVLFGMSRLFPYGFPGKKTWIFGVITLVQAFIPVSFLFYIVSAFILMNLFKVGIDICLGFLVFLVICSICYFRIDNKYSYLAVVVAVMWYLRLGIFIPAVLAIAVGLEAFVPVASGVIIYYFSLALKDAVALLQGTDGNKIGVGLMFIANNMLKNQTFIIVLSASCITVILTSTLRKVFNVNASTIAACVGNAAMAFILIAGGMYVKLTLPLWLILAEMLVGIAICMVVELFRGIGDVTRIEKTVFEDDEYIYYVKAVPKIKVALSEPNIKNMNQSIQEEENAKNQEMSDVTEEDTLEEIKGVEEEKLPQTDSLKEDTSEENILEENLSEEDVLEEIPAEEISEEEISEEDIPVEDTFESDEANRIEETDPQEENITEEATESSEDFLERD